MARSDVKSVIVEGQAILNEHVSAAFQEAPIVSRRPRLTRNELGSKVKMRYRMGRRLKAERKKCVLKEIEYPEIRLLYEYNIPLVHEATRHRLVAAVKAARVKCREKYPELFG